MRGGESSAVVAMAVSLKLAPHGTLGAASAGMLSVDGRCKTLDARANGYARSEGVGALVVRRGDEGTRLCGSAVRQDGRSASLTAPNGSAQRTLLLGALGRGALGVSEMGGIEAHGTGTALGDPTEAGALAAVHGSEDRTRPVVVGAAKASVGHSEAASGQVGVLRLSALAGVMGGNAQLRSLNPLVGARLGSACGRLVMPLHAAATSGLACGVSSFGYSGTIAHAVLAFGSGGEALGFGRVPDAPEALAFGSRGAEAAGGGVSARCSQSDTGRSTLVCHSRPLYRHRTFPWRDHHPFVQRHMHMLSYDGTIGFRSTAAACISLFSNHVVQGRVIFPGAGYLEVARAAASTALHGVFFLQPLAAEALGLLIECALSDGRFEVRSGEADAVEAARTVHCSGATAPGDAWQRVDHTSLRVASRAADVCALYDGFDAVGLQYGPGYRTLVRAWGGASSALARLRARSTYEGTQVHPADLDDALCTSGVMASSGGGGETRLPFAVDDALLQAAMGELCAVRVHCTAMLTIRARLRADEPVMC